MEMSEKKRVRKKKKPKLPKLGFSKEWLTDDRYKSWIRQVSFDDSLFHCIVCKKNFSCATTHVMRHGDSAYHKNNIKENTSLNNDARSRKKKKKPRKRFQQQWLEIDVFKPWLREVSNDKNSFFCTLCNLTFAGSLSQIYRHAESKSHIMCETEKLKQSETEKNETSISSKDINTNESSLPFLERKKLAEFNYATLVANKNLPHQTAKEVLAFFQAVGKNYNILKNMTMGRTKCTNIISNILYPIELDRMVNCIKNTKFSLFIDEMCDITNENWITFFVRYVEPETLDTRLQLIKLMKIDEKEDDNAEELFDAFKSEMSTLDISFLNIVALSSVMTEKPFVFEQKLKEICKNLLVLACPCNSVALAAHAACAKLPDYCEEFLKNILDFINHSPKRSTVHQKFRECIRETDKKMVKPVVRWLSYYSWIVKLVEFWDTVKLFVEEMAISEKTKTLAYLLSMMQNLNIKAYLFFLKHILRSFHAFNAFFQTVETKIHLLQPKSSELLTTISEHCIKSKHLNNLCNIKFTDKKNQKSLQEVYLGFECEKYLDELMSQGHADIVESIRKNCLQFFVTAAVEIEKRLPYNNKFFSKLKVFQFDAAISDIDRETSFKEVSYIAETLGGFDENGLKREWFTLHLDFTTEKEKLFRLNFDDMWKQIFQSSTNIDKYPNLKCLLNAVRSLSTTNADPEIMFSVLIDLKTSKRNKLSPASLNAICIFKSALKTRQETALNMKIDAKHFSRMSSEKLYNYVSKRQKRNTSSSAADKKLKRSTSPPAAEELFDAFKLETVHDIAGPSSSDV